MSALPAPRTVISEKEAVATAIAPPIDGEVPLAPNVTRTPLRSSTPPSLPTPASLGDCRDQAGTSPWISGWQRDLDRGAPAGGAADLH